jgi:hypothetical protein
MGGKEKEDRDVTLLEGLSRIKPKDLRITLSRSESAALNKAFREEEKARKNNFALRRSIKR